MIHRLAELLEIPLRDRNALLLAAGFAPAFQEGLIDDLKAARAAMDRVLQAHKPFPAFAVDRRWNIVLSNRALPQLYEGCREALLKPPVNAMRLMLHPGGLGPRVLNFSAWRAQCLHTLRQQIAVKPDPVLQELLAEVAAYPEPCGRVGDSSFEGPERLATPLRVATRLGTMCFLSTVTVFGTACCSMVVATENDIALAELALEMLFPADDQTARIAARMVAEVKEREAATAPVSEGQEA
jgi:hypothetical protein